MFDFERKRTEKFLGSLTYPVSKERIIEQAAQAELPHQVLLLMQRLDERQYASADEVEQDLAAHKA